MTGIVLTRVERQNTRRQHDMIHAKRYAHTAIELGLDRILQNPNWRTQYPNGVWETMSFAESGEIVIEGIDPADDRLDDNSTESIKMTGTGVVGMARQKESVILDYKDVPLDCLETAVAVRGDITTSYATVQADAVITSNDDIYAWGSEVYADVEAADRIDGSTYHGQQSPSHTSRELPSRLSVLTSYRQEGTWIPIGLFPYRNGAFRIEDRSFDPTTNPVSLFGNAKGIYAVYCYGYSVVVEDSHFVGTLVLDNAGSSTRVTGNCTFEPAETGYPSLLVDGDLTIDLNADGALSGIVYATDDVFVDRLPILNGTLVVADRLEIDGPMNVVHNLDAVRLPPPGFRAAQGMMKIRPGSWRREVD
ncbi:hypothetical protein [Thalassoroseus pseudoceratinae]|uniref:hypothetical protein n=1 Tax=Thalassoroseus pseudoceratinae TaxID=2713176 RepID=UPI00142235DC|nr:hypothetical protein [Thalassoroseus pseudoceratinae]